ncbi:MAG: deoxyribose-phosphate aldolase, partial [Crocinitomicaceae bacterium]|nr:deoxyribose-phosphate aldolase [Crocinitomicaceae bacterium]
TSLNAFETKGSIQSFVDKAKDLSQKGMNVAGVCTYSYYAELLVKELQNSSISSVVVLGGFPHSQISLEMKLAEIDEAVAFGVDEIDIVISHHLVKENRLDELQNEFTLIRKHASSKILKLILETGHFDALSQLHFISKMACESGFDFLKTSTGKIHEGATPDKFKVMCETIKEFHATNRKRIGIKASGGIRTVTDANQYVEIVREILGKEHLKPEFFRIGASSLLNEL